MLRDPRREGRRRCCPRLVGFGLGEPDLSSVQLVKDLTWSLRTEGYRVICRQCLLLSRVNGRQRDRGAEPRALSSCPRSLTEQGGHSRHSVGKLEEYFRHGWLVIISGCTA